MSSVQEHFQIIGLASKAHEYGQLLSEEGVDHWDQLLRLRHRNFQEKGLRGKDLEAELFCNLSYLESRIGAGFLPELLEDIQELIEMWPGYDLLQKRESARPLVTRLHELEEATRKGEDLFAEKLRVVDPRLAQIYLLFYFLRAHQVPLQEQPAQLSSAVYNFAASWPLRKNASALLQNGSLSWVERLYPPQIVMTHPDCVWALYQHQGIVTRVATCKNIVLSASEDGTLAVWDILSGERYHSLKHDGAVVHSLALTETAALSGDNQGKIRVWNTFTGECLHLFQAHSEKITALAINLDATLALSGSVDGTIKLWEIRTGRCLHILQGHQGWVSALQFGTDAKSAYSASGDRTIKKWDLASNSCTHTLGLPLQPKSYEVDLGYQPLASSGHTDDVTSMTLREPYLLSGCRDRKVRLWHLASGICQLTMEGHTAAVTAVAMTRDAKIGISCGADDTLRLWDLHSGKCLRALSTHSIALNSLCMSGDEQMIFTGGWDHSVKRWNIWTGQARVDLFTPKYTGSVDIRDRWALSAHRDSTICLWEVERGKCVGRLEGHTAEVKAVSFLDQSNQAISASLDGTLRIWDLTTRRSLHIFKQPGVAVQTFHAWADDIIWIDSNSRVHSWKRGEATSQLLIGSSGAAITASAFTSESELILGYNDGSIVSYPFIDEKRREVWLQASDHPVTALHTSPDNAHLVAGHSNGLLRVYRLGSRGELHVLSHHRAPIRAIAFSANHEWAISADMQGWLLIWNLQSAAIKARHYSKVPWTALSSARADNVLVAATENGVEFLRFHLF